MCEIGELDPCSAWSETERKARKQHRCNCCRGLIAPKERYLVNFNVHEGEMSSTRMCLACAAARKLFCEDHTDGQLCDGPTFRELLLGCIADGDEESDQKWRPMLDAMKARQAAADGAR